MREVQSLQSVLQQTQDQLPQSQAQIESEVNRHVRKEMSFYQSLVEQRVVQQKQHILTLAATDATFHEAAFPRNAIEFWCSTYNFLLSTTSTCLYKSFGAPHFEKLNSKVDYLLNCHRLKY